MTDDKNKQGQLLSESLMTAAVGVLGSMLIDEAAVGPMLMAVAEEDFQLPEQRTIFRCMAQLYREEDLPADRDAAIRRLRAFIRDLRSQRKAQGLPTRYIYVTEGLHGDHRIHHHLVLNGTGRDAEAIRALWTWGDQVEIQPLDDDHYEALAKYLTKEPREHGNAEVGARTWTPSLGLRRPEVETADVPDAVTLTAPPGAIILERTVHPTEFGEFAYLKYYLPRPRRPVPERYVRPRENRTATPRNSGLKP